MKKILRYVASILVSLLVILTLADAAQLKEARVTQIVSDVKLLSQQAAPHPAALNDPVRNGTAVRTGTQSRSELTFTDLTITRLGANTIFSFEAGTRTMDLRDGAVLFQVPKGSGGATIRTTAVTAAITGTTGIGEFHPATSTRPHPFSKWLCLEGTFHLTLPNGQSVEIGPGKMVTTNGESFSPVMTFNISQVMQTSLLVTGYDTPLASLPLIQIEEANQEGLITRTPITNRSTLFDPSDIIDVVDQGMTAQESPTVTPTPPITPTPSTPTPTPSKFGALTTIASSDPYVITGGTTITTDPSITTNGVTDFGKIYRGLAQDGPFATYLFGSTSAFDMTGGIATNTDVLPIAVFKFQSLSLLGNPTIDLSNGGVTNLALVAVDGITSGPPGGTLTFAGLGALLLATVDGSINLTSDVSFQNIKEFEIYARGAGSNLTLASPILGSDNVGLIAEGSMRLMIGLTAAERLKFVTGGDLVTTGPGGSAVFELDNIGGTIAGIQGNRGNITLSVGGNLSSQSLSLLLANNAGGNISGTGGNIDVTTGGTFTSSGAATFTIQNTTGMINDGGNLTLDIGGSVSTAGALSLLVENYDETANPAGQIGMGGNISLTTGGDLTADFASIVINNRGGGMIGSDVNLTINIGGALTTLHDGPGFLDVPASLGVFLSSRYDDQFGNTQAPAIGGNATLNLQADSASIGGLLDVTISDRGGSIGGNALLQFNITNDISVSGVGNLIQLFNDSGQPDGAATPLGGTIHGDATLQISIGNLSVPNGSLDVFINNRNQAVTGGTIGGDAVIDLSASAISVGTDLFPHISNERDSSATGSTGGLIGGDAAISLNIAGALSTGGDAGLSIQNFNNGGSSGGTIGGDATLNLTAGGDLSIAGDFNAAIDNHNGGTIGGDAAIGLTAASAGIDITGVASFHITNNDGGHIGGHANIVVTTGGAFSANSIDALINNRNAGSIGSGSDMIFNIGGVLTTASDASFVTSTRNDGNGGGTIGANVILTLNAASASIGGFFITDISTNGGGTISNGTVNVSVPGNLVATGGAEIDIQNTGFNVFGGPFIGAATINTDAKVNVTAGSISSGDFVDVEIDNNGAGHIGRDAIITTTVSHNVSSQTDMYFDLTNQANGGAVAGFIGRNASINLSAANISAGGLLDVELINDAGGHIGGNALMNVHASGTITAQEDTYIELLNRLQNNNNEGSIGGNIVGNATNNFSAGGNVTIQGLLEIGVLNNDSRVLNGAGHIGGDAGIVFSAANVSSTGFLNLVIDDVQGSIDGASTIDAHASNISTDDSVFAELVNNNGQIGSDASVSLITAGNINVTHDVAFELFNPNGAIGGNATLNGNATNVTAGGTLFAFIDNSGDASIGGNATINMNISGNASSTDTTIQINGSDNAQGAAININGGNYNATGQFFSAIDGNGTLAFNNASVHADVLKAGVFGTNGVLNIGGGTLSADTTLKLYATGSNGQINFISNVTLGGLSAKILAANSITIFNGVVVTVGNIADENPADVYTNHANYSSDFGGNDSTTGTFAGSGANDPQPLPSAPPFNESPRPAVVHHSPQVSLTRPHAVPSARGGLPHRRGGDVKIADRRPAHPVIKITDSDQLLSLLDGAAPGPSGKITVPASKSRSGPNPASGANASRQLSSNLRTPSYPPSRLP